MFDGLWVAAILDFGNKDKFQNVRPHNKQQNNTSTTFLSKHIHFSTFERLWVAAIFDFGN